MAKDASQLRKTLEPGENYGYPNGTVCLDGKLISTQEAAEHTRKVLQEIERKNNPNSQDL